MESLGRLILRLFLVPLGAVVAFCVAALVMVAAHWGAFHALANADAQAQEDWMVAFVMAGPVIAMFLAVSAVFTVMAAAAGALIAEAFAIRSWIYHAANGGLAAWIGWSTMQDIDSSTRFLAEPKIMVAAGLAAGLAYWVVAGSTAGFWKPIRQRPLNPPSN
jgi:hypothetical protein